MGSIFIYFKNFFLRLGLFFAVGYIIEIILGNDYSSIIDLISYIYGSAASYVLTYDLAVFIKDFVLIIFSISFFKFLTFHD